MKYMHLVDWETQGSWNVKRPATTAEEDQLIEAGFEYVRFDDKNQPDSPKEEMIHAKTPWINFILACFA
jgi:hypothetical protein